MKWAQYLLIPYLALTAACGQKVDSSQWGSPAPVLTDTPPSSMKILVVGGTSGVGLETVKLALERGHDVIAAARHPERMTITNSHLHVVKSDILDPTSIGKAIQGVDSVVIAIGISPTRDSVSVFSEGSANVLTAMKHHGVTRLITVTGIGAGDSRGHGGFFYDNILQPILLGTIYEDKDRSEELVAGSNTNWTIVRPGFLNDEAAKNSYRVIEDLSGVTSGDIARKDVAHFIVSALETNSHREQRVLITN